MEEYLEQVDTHFFIACGSKDIARKKLKNTTFFFIAANHFKKAAELIDTYINNFEQDFRIKMNLLRIYYLFEEKECRIAIHYRTRNFEPIESLFIEYEQCIKYLINEGKKQIDLVNSKEIRIFLQDQYKFWEFLELNYRTSYDGAKARYFFDREEYVEAIDFYNENQKKYLLVLENLKKNESIKPIFKRIAEGNIFGTLANIPSAKFGIYLKMLEDKFNVDTLNNAIKEAMSFIEFSEKAFNANLEWTEYNDGVNGMRSNLKKILEDTKENWNEIYLAFEKNELINQSMKIIDNNKYQEIKKLYEKEIKTVTNNITVTNNNGTAIVVAENNGTINANNIMNDLEEKTKFFLEELEKSNISDDDKEKAKYYAEELRNAEIEKKPKFAIQNIVNGIKGITALFNTADGLASAANNFIEHFPK